MRTRFVHSITLSILICLSFIPPVFSESLQNVKVAHSEVNGVCNEIEGKYPVSIQAAVQFEMAGDDSSANILYGNPEAKSFQSFKCGKVKSTIYYYQYGDVKEVAEHIGAIKAVIWGEQGPSKMHPESILNIDNIIIVVSSRQPWFFTRLLNTRATFPNLENTVIDKRFELLQCVKNSIKADICSALTDFKIGVFPTGHMQNESILIGRSWEISSKGEVGGNNFEVLYIKNLTESSSVAAFGPIIPENDDEIRQVKAQILAQANNKLGPSTDGLFSFIRSTLGKTSAYTHKTKNGSLAFIGMGNQVYVRYSNGHIVLLTKLLHDSNSQPYILSVFPVEPKESD